MTGVQTCALPISAVIRGNDCTLGLPEWILTGDLRLRPDYKKTSIVIPPTVVRGLAKDLLTRYAKAFGGKREFLRAVGRLGHFELNDLPPALRSEYEKFSR